MANGDRKRRIRERTGWTILYLVVTLSRLAVWVDDAIGAEPDARSEDRQ